ncbi:MAG: bacterial Ig-like domain-containing protein [Acholeplasmataceae bacterium]|nr:bacterial Ig-like domain-containing protein [Acholeplasmataceae bacterium]
MKKLMTVLFSLIVSLSLLGCDKDKDLGPTPNTLSNYATVELRFMYQENTVNDWKTKYHDKNKWGYTTSNLSDVSKSFIMNYINQKDLLNDYSKIMSSLDYTNIIYLNLHTTGREININSSITKEDLIKEMNLYKDTALTYESLEFQTHYITLEEMFINGSVIIDSMETYKSLTTDFPITIEEDFFSNRSMIVVGGYRSGSLLIDSIESLFYLNDSTLEVALTSSAATPMFTDDLRYYTVVVSVEKAILNNINRIISHHHITFEDGSYSDKPFHNTVDDIELNDYVRMYIGLPPKLVFQKGAYVDLTYLEVYLINTDGHYEYIPSEYSLSAYDSNHVGNQTIYVSYKGFTKSFKIEIIEFNEFLQLLYSNKPTVSDDILSDGYIDDYETYLKLNLDLQIDETFFETYSLFLHRYISSNTNLERVLTKYEVIDNLLYLHIYKPEYSAGEALIAGQLVFKVSKDLRNINDTIELVHNRNLL